MSSRYGKCYCNNNDCDGSCEHQSRKHKIVYVRGPPGPDGHRGQKGDRGFKGERGPAGETADMTYAYIHATQSIDLVLAPGASVVFNNVPADTQSDIVIVAGVPGNTFLINTSGVYEYYVYLAGTIVPQPLPTDPPQTESLNNMRIGVFVNGIVTSSHIYESAQYEIYTSIPTEKYIAGTNLLNLVEDDLITVRNLSTVLLNGTTSSNGTPSPASISLAVVTTDSTPTIDSVDMPNVIFALYYVAPEPSPP